MQQREGGSRDERKWRKKKINTPVKDNKILRRGALVQRGELGTQGERDGKNDGGAKVIEMTSELQAGRQREGKRGKTTVCVPSAAYYMCNKQLFETVAAEGNYNDFLFVYA